MFVCALEGSWEISIERSSNWDRGGRPWQCEATLVLNDATLVDVHTVGLDETVEVIDNGSDAPGTILADCGEGSRRRFAESGLIIAKGQGNFESLSDEPDRVIADTSGAPMDTHVLMRPPCCAAMHGHDGPL